MAEQLLLMRHGAVAPAWAGRYFGSSDVPLGPDALREVRAAAPLIRARGPACCFVSPQRRAVETACPIAAAAGLVPEVDPDLREIDFGRWEGKTFAEIAASDPAAVDRWAAFDDGFAFPEGERLAAFLARVGRAADRLASHPARVVLAVTHAGVIGAMICRFLGLPPRSYVLFRIRTASLTAIDLFDGRGVLSGLNLAGAPEDG